MKYFLAPRSNETAYQSFLSTIEHGLDYTIVEQCLTDHGKKILSKKPKIFAWGCKESLKSRWGKMQIGDTVLFYKGREHDDKEGKFIYAGQLIYKQDSPDLGTTLWPPKKDQEPWSCVFFLDKVSEIYIPFSELRNIAGYKDSFDRIQGFQPLNDKGNEIWNKKFKTYEDLIKAYPPREDEDINDQTLDEDPSNNIATHSEAQLFLLKVGQLLEFETYCPDKSAEAFGEKLSNHISLTSLPTRFLGEDIQPIVSKIDVIWFQDEVPIYAFEVEHTTGVQPGLQRLCQLIPLDVKLFIISHPKSEYLYNKFMKADPYYKFKKSFRFKTYQQLEKYFRAVSEFCTLNKSFLK